MKKLTSLLVGLSLLFSACACLHKSQTPKRNFSANNNAIVPVERTDQLRNWWVERHASVLKQVKEHPGTQLIFIGDSITQGWESANDIWSYYFGAYEPINMGFGGDTTQHVLWRLDHGSLDGISPKVAVLLIGVNNAALGNTAEQIAEGTTMIVDRLRARLPRTKVLILGIFPWGEKPNSGRAICSRVNEIVAKLADNKHVFYLDFGQNFLNPDQTLSKDIMPDFLHPNRIGYQIWGISIKDKLAELMK